MNIVFMGTPDFAVPSLKKIIEKHSVKAVFTQPDRPKGRGKKLAMSPVKEVAIEHNIPVFQPEKLKNELDTIKMLQEMKPDFIIVVAFGQILPEDVLKAPRYACINLHASLLPRYRGAAPINWAIINGEKKAGVTTMLMEKGLDTGDMLQKFQTDVSEDMTFEELHDILKEEGAELLLKTMEDYAAGKITPIKQNDAESNYAPLLKKDTGKINWNDSADKIHNLVRGLYPAPSAYTNYNDSVMKIHSTKIVDMSTNKEPGLIEEVNNDGILVSTGKGKLLITAVQFPGKKLMSVKDYIKGNNIEKGIFLR